VSQSRQGQRPKRPAPPIQQKKRRTFPWWTLPVIAVCLALLVTAWSFAENQVNTYNRFNQMRGAIGGNTFYGPVYIDDVAVNGMTREEAREALSGNREAHANAFEVILTHGEASYRIASDDVPMTWNTEELLDKAYMIGRAGTLEERYNQVQALKTPIYLNSEFVYDKSAVRGRTDSIARELTTEGRDASVVAFDVGNRSFAFSNEVLGQRVDAEGLYQTVIDHLDNGLYGAVILVEVENVTPKVTRAQLERDYTRIASFSTNTTSEEKRNTNIRLSADALNGQMIAPGGTISFNEVTGERTREKGYQEAGAIENGRTVMETGGGVCQTATTLFNALVRADCEIVTRRPHAWPSDYVPRGEDATVDWPRLDLVMRNTSDTPMFVTAWYQDRVVTVEVYGLSLGEGISIDISSETTYSKQPTETVYTYNAKLPIGTTQLLKKPRTGYSVQTYKLWKYNDEVTGREAFYKSEYSTINEEYEYNDGKPPEGY